MACAWLHRATGRTPCRRSSASRPPGTAEPQLGSSERLAEGKDAAQPEPVSADRRPWEEYRQSGERGIHLAQANSTSSVGDRGDPRIPCRRSPASRPPGTAALPSGSLERLAGREDRARSWLVVGAPLRAQGCLREGNAAARESGDPRRDPCSRPHPPRAEAGSTTDSGSLRQVDTPLRRLAFPGADRAADHAGQGRRGIGGLRQADAPLSRWMGWGRSWRMDSRLAARMRWRCRPSAKVVGGSPPLSMAA